MNQAVSSIASVTSSSVGTSSPNGQVELEIVGPESGEDAAQFRAALERQMHMKAAADPVEASAGSKNNSLGQEIAARTASLASEMQKNQQHVSQMLEQATRTGDSMQLMKAMMALNDHEIRVQTITKTVSKASSSIEQLTKLQ